MLDYIRRMRLQNRIKRHRELLERTCTIGKGLCAAPWVKDAAILSFTVRNLTNDPTKVRVGDNCLLSGNIHCNRLGKVVVGDHVFMNGGTILRCDYEITVGNCCLFGPNVRLWDTSNHPMSVAARERQAREICFKEVDSYEASGGPIIIEDNVWLGMDVIVLANVRIGRGSVVGAGSVVTKDIPPMTFAAGVPARFISNVPE